MNNLSSYCGLVDATIRASDKDLPVPNIKFIPITPSFPLMAGIFNMIVGRYMPIRYL